MREFMGMCYECEHYIADEEFECEVCEEHFCSEICIYKHNERMTVGCITERDKAHMTPEQLEDIEAIKVLIEAKKNRIFRVN